MAPRRRILLPIDGSQGSLRAAAFAGGLARDTGADVALVYVYDAPAAVAMGLLSAPPSQLAEDQVRKVQGYFAKAKEALGEVEVAEHLIEIGHPAERIMAIARSEDVWLIVMGTRGMSPIQELLVGSVSERVVRGAHCAVTLVR